MNTVIIKAIAGIVIFGIIFSFITGSDFMGMISDLLPTGVEINSNSGINYKSGLKESTSFMKSIGAMK